MKKEIKGSFSSNGNLIITGEYFVLIGAKALAVPLKFGQQMRVEVLEDNHQTIIWNTYELGKLLFRAVFESENTVINSSSDKEKGLMLRKLLNFIRRKNRKLFENRSLLITCEMNFNSSWGWGSSSTLISNLADWSGLDAFELNSLISPGSGYDIAASRSSTPIFFRIADHNHFIDHIRFDPVYKDHIFFLYSGKKQNTAKSILTNIESVRENKEMISFISSLTEKIATEKNLDEFMRYITEHETVIARVLKATRIKEMFFNDFEGEIKSLGAWGGDFFMVVTRLTETKVREYFSSRNLDTIFRFDDIIMN